MSVRLVPKFVEGNSRKDAQMKLLRIQLARKAQFNVVSIYESGAKTIIWYMDEVTSREVMDQQKQMSEDLINGTSK